MWCGLYLLCLAVAGYPVIAGLARGRSRLETIGLSLCMGPGLIAICLIYLSLLGVRPGRAEILVMTGACAVAAMVLGRRDRHEIAGEEGGRVFKLWAVICVAAIAYGLCAVAIDTVHYPVIEWDAFAIWQLKAQVLTLLPLHPRPAYFSDLNLSYSHLRYPLLVPMMSAGAHAMTGRLDDSSKTIALLLYPGMGIAVFAVVRRIKGTTAALTATALLACAQPMLRYGGSGTAEMALTAFYACSILCLLRWRESGSWGYVVLCALFSAWMTWTKNEGLALAAINAVVLAGIRSPGPRRRTMMAAAIFMLIVAVIYLPWIAFSWGLPRTDEDYAGYLNIHEIISNLARVPTILEAIGLEMVNWRNWGFFWLLAAILAMFQPRRFASPAVAMVGVLLGLHLLAYLPPLMVVKSWNLDDLLLVTSDRLLMHAAPAAAILIGLLLPGRAGGKPADLSRINRAGEI
jgi:Dolichyl-phosphate-mannose-protein mannosyltransferase